MRSVPVKKNKQPRPRTVMAASRKRNATCATSAKIVNLLGVVEPLINLTMYMVNVYKHCIHINVTPDSKCDNCGPRYGECAKQEDGENDQGPCPDTCGFRQVTFQGEDTAQKFRE